jgi:diaminohydroxyphosphoribosylaminopyrimidine deaminase/5-amino-6-(5-phosphoribosylamino)uracil reductase
LVTSAAPEDLSFMAEALRLAARIPRRPWPNPPVGALVVRDGRIVGRGAHHGAGTAHAEVLALDEAGALARGATLYCTLEPCNHWGRTPPCATRVAASGVQRLVVGIADPNRAVTGGGLGVVAAAGIDVTVGVLSRETLDLIWPFAATRAFQRPFVLLKTAASLDGRFGPGARDAGTPAGPFYMTGEEARRDVHRLRRWADVVVVGEDTLVADQPLLNGRLVRDEDNCPAADPVPGYVDTDLSYAGTWPAERPLVFAGRDRTDAAARARLERQGVTVVTCEERDGHVAPESLLDRVFNGIGRVVMIEGGPRLASAFLEAGLVDRWVHYTAPLLLGDGPAWPAWRFRADVSEGRRFHLTRVEPIHGDMKAVFDRQPFDQVACDLTPRAVQPGRGGDGGA